MARISWPSGSPDSPLRNSIGSPSISPKESWVDLVAEAEQRTQLLDVAALGGFDDQVVHPPDRLRQPVEIVDDLGQRTVFVDRPAGRCRSAHLLRRRDPQDLRGWGDCSGSGAAPYRREWWRWGRLPGRPGGGSSSRPISESAAAGPTAARKTPRLQRQDAASQTSAARPEAVRRFCRAIMNSSSSSGVASLESPGPLDQETAGAGVNAATDPARIPLRQPGRACARSARARPVRRWPAAVRQARWQAPPRR